MVFDDATGTRRRLGRYEIVRRLAIGGMAEVLLGRLGGPHGFEKTVVIKRILPELTSAPGFREMFLDEARLLATIRHPNVVQVHELGEGGGELYMVMEHLEGESIAALLRRCWERQRMIEPAVAALIGAAACAGLHAAHELTDAQGRALHVVHRDVSPQNLFVTHDGQVKLLDFGVAKAHGRHTRTETGLLKGKACYMSPEQSLGQALDRRSDVFSLGVVLHELCTTRRLFDRENPLLVFRAICEEPIPPISATRADFPPELDRIVAKALARAPAGRYATALEMRRDLLAIARELADSEPEELLAAAMRELGPAAAIPAVETDDEGTATTTLSPAATSPSAAGRRPRRWTPRAAIGVGLGATGVLALAVSLGPGQFGARPVSSATEPPATHREAMVPMVAPTPAGEPEPRPEPAGPESIAPAAAPTARIRPPRINTAARRSPGPPGQARGSAAAPTTLARDPLAEAEGLLATGHVTQACGLAEATATDAHARPATWEFLGRCYMRLGRAEQARAYFRTFLAVAPSDPNAVFIRAIVDSPERSSPENSTKGH